MIETGWAIAFLRYGDYYVGAEAKAKAARAGIWGSSFDPPEEWRTAHEPAPRTNARPSVQRFAAPVPTDFSGC